MTLLCQMSSIAKNGNVVVCCVGTFEYVMDCVVATSLRKTNTQSKYVLTSTRSAYTLNERTLHHSKQTTDIFITPIYVVNGSIYKTSAAGQFENLKIEYQAHPTNQSITNNC